MPGNNQIHAQKQILDSSPGSGYERMIIWISLSLVFVLAILDIAGWIFKLSFLISMGPNWESMKLITALCFILSGFILCTMILKLKLSGFKIFSYGASVLILLISLFSIYIYLQLFITGNESSIIHFPLFKTFLANDKKMAFLTSVSFFLLAFILFLLTMSKRSADGLAHILVIPVFIISYFTIVSYLLGVPYATRFENVAIALNTGVAFTCLCIVIAYIRPTTWLMRFYNLPTLGGIISRRLLLPAILVPIIIGWLRIQGERRGLFESGQGVVLVSIFYSVCFLLMVWSAARYVNKLDSKRRESEETLRQSEERFRTIAETVPVLVCITRIEDSVVLFTNELNNKTFGLRGEDIIGTKGPDYYWNRSDRERMVKAFREHGFVSNFEIKVKKSDGTPFWIMTSVRPITFRGQAAMIGASIDITESKKIEEELLISEERFRAIAENIPDLIVRFDHDLRLQYANPAVLKVTGLTIESLLGKTASEFGAEQSSSLIWEKTARAVLGSGKPQRIEVQNNWQGVTKVFDTHIVPEIDIQGKVSSVILISRDITEKKQFENALKNSEQKLKYHLENSPLAVVEWDNEFKILQWSDEAERIFGLKKADILGLRIDQLNIIYEEDIPLVEKTMTRLISGKERKVISQNRNKTKTGEIVECIWYNSVLLDEHGEMNSVMSLVEDVTLLRRTERELIESRESYKELVTNARSIIVKLDVEGRFTFVNEFAQNFFGYSREELLGKQAMDIIVPRTESTGRQLDKLVENIIDDPDKYSVNINENIKKNGELVWVEWHNKTLFDESGIRTGHLSIGIDITQRKLAEDKLKRSEALYRAIGESIDYGVWVCDADGKNTYASDSYLKMVGMTQEQCSDFGWGDTLHPDDAEKTIAAWKECARTGSKWDIEHRFRGVDGKWHPILARGIPIRDDNGNIVMWAGINLDMSSIKKAQEELKLSEERFRNLVKYAPAVIYEMDIHGKKFISVNDTMCNILGYSREELLLIKPIDLLDDSSKLLFKNRIKRNLRSEKIDEDVEYRIRKKDGEWIYSLITVGNTSYSDDTEHNITVIAYDITERKRVEKAISDSEKRFRELVKYAPTAIYELDFLTRKFLTVNDAMCKMSGYSREELLSVDALDLLDIESRALFLSRIEKCFKGEKPDDNVEYNVIAKDGRIINAILNMKFNFNENGIPVGAMVVGHDITERKHAEEKILKAGEALKESESKLRSVLDATQESVYMFDPEGHFTMSNATGLSRFNNISENDLLGHHFSEFIPASLARARQQKLDKVFKTGKVLEFTDERAERIYHHNFIPVFRNEKVSSVVSYSSDITERKKSEDNLKASEDRFRTISESLTVIISITRISDAILTFVNEPFEKAFVYKKEKLIGKKYPSCFYYPDEFISIRDTLRAGGSVDNQEIKVRKSDGSAFWIMITVRKINFMNEPSYLSTAIDITESKNTQLELIRLNRTLDAHSKSSQAMMHSKNELNYIREVCKIIIKDCGHAMVWVGYAENDRRKSVRPVAHYGFNQGYIDRMDITWDDTERGRGPTGVAIRTGEIAMCRNMLTDPAFKPWRESATENGYASSVVLPLKADGKPFGAISIYSKEPDPFSDLEITLLSELADDLAYGISFIRLAESEREAARIMKESESKLKELIATKDKFFNIVAHDLKNPFTSLLGSSELLYDNIDQMSRENIIDLALILNDSAKGGYAILQNLLDWSRSQTGLLIFNPQDTNLRTIIDENIENLHLQTTTKGISLTSELTDNLFICSDRNMINTVLRNLLSNAIKYTHKNGKVVVEVLQSSKEVIVSVKDTGTGMTKEKVDSLFRLENALSTPGTEKEQGTGLGLKLCKEFTERMGGKIWVESEEGKGSEFKFTIPLKHECGKYI